MIAVQSIVDKLESALDAEGSDRYTFEQDYREAINVAVDWLQAIFNKAFADKKLTEENLQFLVKAVVFQASGFSRIDTGLLPDSIWSILRINPDPIIDPAANPLMGQAPNVSFFRNDLRYIKSDFSAKRLSLEQWEENSGNIFEAGNTVMKSGLKSYAYLNHVSYSSSSSAEIEIRPSVANQFVGVTYLKYPTPIQLITDSIEFPKSLTNLVVGKALNFISIKQGDQTNLYSVSSNEVISLVQQMM